MKAGCLFTGAGGLDLAVEAMFGAQPAWVCETDAAASRVLAVRFSGVPNLGDVTTATWPQVPAVDLVCGGYPCQPDSISGRKRGTEDDRWLWPAMHDAIRALRPRLVVGENVRNHLRMGITHVLADLQRAGYAVTWCVAAASDIGAPHQRQRVFWLAWPEAHGAPVQLGMAFADLGPDGWEELDLFGGTTPEWPVAGTAYAGTAYAGTAYAGTAYAGTAPSDLLPTPLTSDVNGPRLDGDVQLRAVTDLFRTPTAQLAINGGSQHPDKRRSGGHGPTLANEIEHLLPTPRTTDANGIGHHGDGGADLRTAIDLLPTSLPAGVQPERWGRFAAAIARWEAITRPAPDPTQPGRHGKPRLSAEFVEWMMGWPHGWVTDVPGIGRNDAIRMGGNGVVPQQAVAALGWLARLLPTAREATA